MPSRLEPGGLCRSDGKRPDRVSIIPWKDGTCPDTYVPSHQRVSAGGAGLVAEYVEQAKCSKYVLLQTKYTFVPIGIETSGSFGPSALSFTKDLGRRLKLHTFEPNSCQYLMQRLSVAVQRTNLVAVLGTFGSSNGDSCFLF